MKFVSDILNSKKKDVWTINAKDTTYNALVIMSEKEIGALMVVDDAGGIVGILTERDYARKIILKGKSSKNTAVEELMTKIENAFTVKPDTTIDQCMVIITGKHVRHLPVFDAGNFMGLVSIGDVVKAKISEQEFLIEQLSDYITGKYAT